MTLVLAKRHCGQYIVILTKLVKYYNKTKLKTVYVIVKN